MAINKLNSTFVDGSTVINASMLNAFQNKINELVDAANGSSSGGTQGGGDTGGGQQTPTVANLFVLNDSTFGISLRSSDGVLVVNAPMCLSGYIDVKASTKYTFKARYVVAWYDSAKTFISASSSTDTKLTLTSPSNAAYCRFSFNFDDNDAMGMVMNEGDTLLQNTQAQTLPNYPELIDVSKLSANTGLQSSNGATVNFEGYKCTDYTTVKSNTQYTFKNRWVVAWYDSSKTFISASPSSESTKLTLNSPSNAAYCRFSIPASTDDKYIGMNEGHIACNI